MDILMYVMGVRESARVIVEESARTAQIKQKNTMTEIPLTTRRQSTVIVTQ